MLQWKEKSHPTTKGNKSFIREQCHFKSTGYERKANQKRLPEQLLNDKGINFLLDIAKS